METKFKLAIYATIVVLCLATQSVTAQWQTNNNTFDFWTQVNPANSAQSVGIGDFNGNSVVPQAALHINTNSGFLPSSPTFNPGEVFRTDAPSGTGNTTYWRMLSGGSNIGSIWNNGTDNNWNLESPNGDMVFSTGTSGPNERMRILGSNGNVGIGTTFPNNQLQLWHNSAVNVYAQFTNNATGIGNGAGDGFLTGVDFQGFATLNQQENLPMLFYTYGNERMRIDANGLVGIGTDSPAYTLDVNGTIAAKQILVEDKTGTKDLLAELTRLRSEVEELKQQLCTLAKN